MAKKRSSRKDRLKRERQLLKSVSEKVKDGNQNKNRDLNEEIMTDTAEPIVQEAVEQPAQQTASQGFNPFSEPVQERPYTKDMIEADMGAEGVVVSNEPIPEPTYEKPVLTDESSSISSNGVSTAPNAEAQSKASPATPIGNDFSVGSSPSSPPPSVGGNPDLQDLDEAQKRKAAKKTADVILASYQKFAPMPFIKIASFNMNKMNKLDMSGKIRLSMPVTEDGSKVGQYMLGNNENVKEVFQVTEDMKKELKDPLVDVLMEQNLALTPTQRLMIAAGGQLMQFTVQSVQILMQNKDAIKQFTQFRENEIRNNSHQSSPSPAPAPTAEEVAPESSVQEETAYESHSAEGVKKETEEESYEPPVLEMDDYLNDEAN